MTIVIKPSFVSIILRIESTAFVTVLCCVALWQLKILKILRILKIIKILISILKIINPKKIRQKDYIGLR